MYDIGFVMLYLYEVLSVFEAFPGAKATLAKDFDTRRNPNRRGQSEHSDELDSVRAYNNRFDCPIMSVLSCDSQVGNVTEGKRGLNEFHTGRDLDLFQALATGKRVLLNTLQTRTGSKRDTRE